MSLRKSFTQTAAHFRKDERGTFAIIGVASLAVLLFGIGTAIDVSRTATAKSRMQGVADVASLAAARSLSTDNRELREIASDVFIQHIGPGGDAFISDVRRDGDAVVVEAEEPVDTTFLRVFGIDEMDTAVTSTSLYAERRMDIALVLDTTFSMDGRKLDTLKDSAQELIDAVEELDSDTVRLAVTPFSQHVNVGMSRRDAVWLDVPADETRPTWRRVRGSERNCRTVNGSGTRDGVPWSGSWRQCDYDWERGPDRTATWQGCVGSRAVPLDERAAFDGVAIPGLLDKPCGSEVLPLTSNMRDVKRSVRRLNAQGETYMPAGLLWGWRMLDASAPFPNTDPAPEGDQVIVLMTDGQNTKSKNGDGHFGTDAVAANNKTRSLCNAIKDRNVTVYTIAYEVTDTPTRNLLEGCATSTSTYFDARNAEDLTAAFSAIADSVKELRISS